MLRVAQRDLAQAVAAHARARQHYADRCARLHRHYARAPGRVLAVGFLGGCGAGRWLRWPTLAAGVWQPWLVRGGQALIARFLRG